MDAEKLLGAFTDQETQEVAAALPDAVFTAEAARRGFTDPTVVGSGSLAIEGAVAAEAAAEADPFQTGIHEFLTSDTPLNAGEQLNIMSEFWQKLGLTAPVLNKEQLKRVRGKLEAHPDRRVVAVPLLGLNDRKAVTEQAKNAFPHSKFNSGYAALWAPDESWTYGKLLRDPESTVKEGRKSYGLRYSTEGGAVSRSELVETLKESGRAVEADDGTVWLFPVMDVQVQSPREYARADKLHAAADITQVPEAIITMQLLHQANGTPNPNWHVDITTEAVYELDKKGNPVAPVSVASGGWDPSGRQVGLRRWSAGRQDGDFGVRGAESGL
jgi:hypothetical protein